MPTTAGNLPVRRQRAGERRSGRREPDAADAPVRRRRRARVSDRCAQLRRGLARPALRLRSGLTLDFGAATNQSTGTFTLASLEQDGFATGKLDDITISEEGLVTATFSNGTTQALGKLAIANFSNPTGLKQRGDARWS
jgi:flagellar hook protein FlgE